MPRPASAQPHNGNRRLWNNASLAVFMASRQSADLLLRFIFSLHRFLFFVLNCLFFLLFFLSFFSFFIFIFIDLFNP